MLKQEGNYDEKGGGDSGSSFPSGSLTAVSVGTDGSTGEEVSILVVSVVSFEAAIGGIVSDDPDMGGN